MSSEPEDVVHFEAGLWHHGHLIDGTIIWFAGEANRETCTWCKAEPKREPRVLTVTTLDREAGVITYSSGANEKEPFVARVKSHPHDFEWLPDERGTDVDHGCGRDGKRS